MVLLYTTLRITSLSENFAGTTRWRSSRSARWQPQGPAAARRTRADVVVDALAHAFGVHPRAPRRRVLATTISPAAGAESSSSTGQLNLVHRDYLRAFVDELPHHLHAFIASHKPTCEDLMLNFLVANATRAPPAARAAPRLLPPRGGGVEHALGDTPVADRVAPPADELPQHARRRLRPADAAPLLELLVASTATLHLPPLRGSGLLGEPNASRAAFHKGRAERLAKRRAGCWGRRGIDDVERPRARFDHIARAHGARRGATKRRTR